MYIFATFHQTLFVEIAISAIEEEGIGKDRILAVPMQSRQQPQKLFDSMHRADGVSMFDVSAILGTVFMLLGAIYGFELHWGPIIWGIIGAVFGISTGLIIRFIARGKKKRFEHNRMSEVVLLIRCEEQECRKIERLLWEHQALGVATIQL